MNSRLIGYVTSLCLLLCLATSANAFRPEDQVVTFANFQYVNYIATSQAKVYVATTGGIIIYDKLTNHWEEPLTGAEGLTATDVQQIWVDRFDQHLYARVDQEYFEYNFTFKRWMTLFDPPQVDVSDKHLAPPTNLIPPFGYNYLGDGVIVDPEARSFTVTDVVDDGDGNLWLGSWGFGLFRSGTVVQNLAHLPFGLLQNAAYAIFQEDQTIWTTGPTLTSSRTGVTGFRLPADSFVYIETGVTPGLPVLDINSLSGNHASLIFGTESGIFLVDRTDHTQIKRVDRRRGIADDNITCLQPIGEDTLFAGTTGGLVFYSITQDVIYQIAQKQFFNHIIYDLALGDGYLWIASDIGAYRLDLASGNLQRFQDPDQVLFNRVFAVESYDRSIWFASDIGLVRLDLTTGSTTPYRVSSTRLDHRALAVNDRLAVVSSERGVTFIFLDRDDLFTRDFSIEDGLASTYVYELRFDGDYLWIGTDKGLTRFYWNNPNRLD